MCATCRKKDIGLNRYDERTSGKEMVITPQGNVYTDVEYVRNNTTSQLRLSCYYRRAAACCLRYTTSHISTEFGCVQLINHEKKKQ